MLAPGTVEINSPQVQCLISRTTVNLLLRSLFDLQAVWARPWKVAWARTTRRCCWGKGCPAKDASQRCAVRMAMWTPRYRASGLTPPPPAGRKQQTQTPPRQTEQPYSWR